MNAQAGRVNGRHFQPNITIGMSSEDNNLDQDKQALEERRRKFQNLEDEFMRESQELAKEEELLRMKEQERLRQERQELLDHATYCQQLADQASDPEQADKYARLAREHYTRAQAIRMPGEEPAIVPQAKVPFWQTRAGQRLAVALQVAAAILVMLWAASMFDVIKTKIVAINAGLPEDARSSYYNLDEFQKFFFHLFVELANVTTVPIKAFILFPAVAWYAASGLRREFTKNLTPWQRVQVTLFLLFCLLLHSALSH
ncbi:hypothetical protein [Tellurirhabdus rosea]|uniref:hypothetical protein n=1 Tax=Tellurirhabdus rosea TaxID=2674997 RepID=UPI00224EC462|nr:hypothetical protein [Tellurirhabdus rosea]